VVKQVTVVGMGGCALFGDGTIKCWGYSNHHRGYGDNSKRGNTMASMGDNLPFISFENPAVSVHGTMKSQCVMLSDGRVKCWGKNIDGQLAHGTVTQTAGDLTYVPFSDLGGTPACFRTNVAPSVPLCEACLSGSFADVVGLSACKQCTAGTHATLSTAEVCDPCALNTYSDVSGSTDCTACPGTDITEETGASSAEQCISKCEIGSGFDESSGACVQCAPGTYSDTFDASACQLCPPNTFSTAVAATTASTCTNCTNSISPAGSSRGADCICTGGYARYP
jgi:hypothetical protein